MGLEEGVTGRLYGIGVGPGDPELMTLKAVRILGASDPDLQQAMVRFQAAQAERVRDKDAAVQAEFSPER